MRTLCLCVIVLAGGMLGCNSQPASPPPMPSWSDPALGGDPAAYGPQQPCYGPNCPRR